MPSHPRAIAQPPEPSLLAGDNIWLLGQDVFRTPLLDSPPYLTRGRTDGAIGPTAHRKNRIESTGSHRTMIHTPPFLLP
ncbi:unnamed protein product [Merluccius merluccius]